MWHVNMTPIYFSKSQSGNSPYAFETIDAVIYHTKNVYQIDILIKETFT